MADWSQLPDELVCSIAQKLHLTADRIRFRSVSKSWRSLIPFPQPPWLMLAEDEQTPNTRGFFGLGQQNPNSQEQTVYQFELPEVFHTKCLGSKGTWLITIDVQQRICLLNPFSRLQIDLPSQLTLEYGPDYDYTPEQLRDGFIWKVVLSSPPSDAQDCIAMAIHHCNKNLAIARPGDASWVAVQTPEVKWADAIFYKGQFYAINHYGALVVCDLGDDKTPPRGTILSDCLTAAVLSDRFRQNNHHVVLYLVEWMGELLFVMKFEHDEDGDEDDWRSYNAETFEIYVFDFVNKEWDELNDLGEYSLFLGFNTSVAVAASQYPGLKNNCIYFTDDYTLGYRGMELPGGRDMGVFDLEDKTVKPHYKGVSTSLYSPPLWIIPLD